MTRLSVNVNKIATLRNSRGGNNPNLVAVAKDCERFGAEGITIHPRPDGRHIKFDDVFALKEIVNSEFNIEGYPDKRFLEIIKKAKPHQATLVPDSPDVLTSNSGWDTKKNRAFLLDVISEIKSYGVRTSLFVETDLEMISEAGEIGTDRIELYTESYAKNYTSNREAAIKPYIEAAKHANSLNLGINAGHDLDLRNLKYFKDEIPNLLEVSIGHALVCDALYLGLENTIQLYLKQLN